jgi:hypothetical protein
MIFVPLQAKPVVRAQGEWRMSAHEQASRMLVYITTGSHNSALQRAARGIKCSAAGGRAESAHERWRARVLRGQRAVAELAS